MDSNGVCKNLDLIIIGCQEYKSSNQCLKCYPEFTLSSDQFECT